MDAHDLKFEDETFDFVYGDSILHHLNMATALDINPIAKLVLCDIAEIKKRFEPNFFTMGFCQFLVVFCLK